MAAVLVLLGEVVVVLLRDNARGERERPRSKERRWYVAVGQGGGRKAVVCV